MVYFFYKSCILVLRPTTVVQGSTMVEEGLMNSLWLFVLVLVSFAGGRLAISTYSVTDFGAKGDGTTNDNKAFLDTWNAACRSAEVSTLLIPAGKTFLLDQIVFEGPCNAYVRVQFDGNIQRPSQLWQGDVDHWIKFYRVHGLSIVGSGQIDGQGGAYWSCKYNHQCWSAPNAVALIHCSNAEVSGLRLINSPMMHLVVVDSVGVHVTGLTITAPGDSPNTDGVHVQHSQHVLVTQSTIGTGDDCVSIGTGTYDVNVTWITCGPGHGISIGSLGAQGSRAAVEHIYVYHCNIFNTMNGVRIKTWQGGSGYARAMTFENISFNAVKNPIIIDQYYCNGGHNCNDQTSAVQVSNVKYIGAAGTSISDIAINLNCSQTVACTDIAMENVNIQPAQGGGKVESYCSNARGTEIATVVPPVPCLTP